MYVDNCIVVAWTKAEIDNVVKELKNANFDVTDKGNICNYLGVRVDKRADGTLRLMQPHLILSILEDLQLGEGSKPCVSPAANTVLLHKHLDAPPHTERWDYCSVVGKLIFLKKIHATGPGICSSSGSAFFHQPKATTLKGCETNWKVFAGQQRQRYNS